MRPLRSPPAVEVEVETVPGGAPTAQHVCLPPTLDERFDLSLVDDVRPVIFDFEATQRVTSYGVREWIRALQNLKHTYYCFVRCRPMVVAQLNMVAGFAGRGELVSFYAPYVCGACSAPFDVLVDLRSRSAVARMHDAPEAVCPSCGGAGVFDDVPEVYFAYATAAPAPAPPPTVLAVLDPTRAAEAAPPPLKIKKTVEGDVTAFWLSGALTSKVSFRRAADGVEGACVMLLDDLDGTNTTNEGLVHFATFASRPELDAEVARVPLPIAIRLHATAPQRVRVVSVLVDANCTACPAVSCVEMDAAAFSGTSPGGVEATPDVTLACPACGAPAQVAFSHEQRKLARALLTAPSPAIAAFLETHDVRTSGNTDAAPSAISFGRYELLELIGRGGMGEIFLACQRGAKGFERRIALKRILPQLSADPTFAEMLVQEARVAALLDHPNIVQILDFGEVDQQYFLAMELVRGRDLRWLLRRARASEQPPSLSIVARIVADAAAAAGAAHRHVDESGQHSPIVHRDISPPNLLISYTGTVKLTDFGIAKAAGSLDPTSVGLVKGKLAYMPPERVVAVGDPVDARTDVFALGVVFFETLALTHPFRRGNEAATLHALINEPLARLRELVPEVPIAIDELVARAMARSRSDRFTDGNELRIAIEESVERSGIKLASSDDLAAWVASLSETTTDEALPSTSRITPLSGAGATSSAGAPTQRDAEPSRTADRTRTR